MYKPWKLFLRFFESFMNLETYAVSLAFIELARKLNFLIEHPTNVLLTFYRYETVNSNKPVVWNRYLVHFHMTLTLELITNH